MAKRAPAPGGLNDLIFLSAIVLLVASGALGVGVFLYQQYLRTESASKLDQLQRAKEAFEPSLIQQLTRLDDRMHAANAVLQAHEAPTLFFQALGQATLQTIYFKTLSYEQTDLQHIVVKMQGVAQSVNSIALQADIFSKNGVITNPIFSGIARQPDGVHFDLVANINPSAIKFNVAVSQNGGQQAAPAAPSVVPVSTNPSSPFEEQGVPTPTSPADTSEDVTSP